MRRIIREDEPLRPSNRISTLKAEARSTASGKRGIDERQFSRTLAGELDWVVMRALEKDRQRRYESASAFAADIQRFLEGEPVEACPPSYSYRLRKYVRKHLTMLLTVSLILSTMAIGTAISTWSAIDANSARKLADERLALANERLKNEQKALAEANRQRERASLNLRQALDAVDKMLLRVADDRLSKLPGAEPIRKELYQESLAFYEELFRQAPDDPQLRRNMAQAWSRVGTLHEDLGDKVKALAALKEAAQRWEVLIREEPDAIELKVGAAEAYDRMAWMEHWTFFRYPTALPMIERCIELWTDVARRRPEEVKYAWSANRMKQTLGDNRKYTGTLAQAEATLREVVVTGRELWDRAPLDLRPDFCLAICTLSHFLTERKRGEPGEDEALMAEAVRRAEQVVSDDPGASVACDLYTWVAAAYASFLTASGRTDEAIALLKHPIEIAQKVSGRLPANELGGFKNFPDVICRLAALLLASKNYEEALKYYSMAAQFNRRGWDALDEAAYYAVSTGTAENGITNCLKELVANGKSDVVRAACEEYDQAGGKRAFDLLIRFRAVNGWHLLGDTQRRGSSLDAAMQLSRELLSRSEKELPQVIRQRLGRAIFIGTADPYFHAGEYEFALPLLNLCVLWTPQDAEILNHRGGAYLDQHNFDLALEDLNESIRINPNLFRGDSYDYRSLAYIRLGKYDRARADLDQGLNQPNLRVARGNLIALLALSIGDRARYQKMCRLLLGRYRTTPDPEDCNLITWSICLAPQAIEDYSEVIAQARRVAAIEVKEPLKKWHLTSLGAVLLRSGDLIEAEQVLTEAVKLCPESDEAIPHCYPQFFLGVVRYQREKTDAALNQLRSAMESANQELAKKDVVIRRRLTVEWLLREAKKLIELMQQEDAAAHRDASHSAAKIVRYLRTSKADLIDQDTVNVSRDTCGPDESSALPAVPHRGPLLKNASQTSQVIALGEDTLGRQQPAANEKLLETIGDLINLGSAYILAREFDKGIVALQDAVTISRTILGEDDLRTLYAGRRLAWGLHTAGRFDQEILILEDALPRHRRILGSDDHETRVLVNNLGRALITTGRAETAVPLLEEVVGQHRRIDGPQHRNTMISLLNLGQVLADLGYCERAIRILRQASELFRNVYGKNHADTMMCFRKLATAYRRTGQPLQAVPLLKDILDRHRQISGRVDADAIHLAAELAEAYAASGETATGLALLESVVRDAVRDLGPDSAFAAAYFVANRQAETEQIANAAIGDERLEQRAAINSLLSRTPIAASGQRLVKLSGSTLGPQHADKQRENASRRHSQLTPP